MVEIDRAEPLENRPFYYINTMSTPELKKKKVARNAELAKKAKEAAAAAEKVMKNDRKMATNDEWTKIINFLISTLFLSYLQASKAHTEEIYNKAKAYEAEYNQVCKWLRIYFCICFIPHAFFLRCWVFWITLLDKYHHLQSYFIIGHHHCINIDHSWNVLPLIVDETPKPTIKFS